MRRKREFFWFKTLCFPLFTVLCLILAMPGLAQGPAGKTGKVSSPQVSGKEALPVPAGEKDKNPKKIPAASFGVAEPKDAASFFQEAGKSASGDPDSSIRLYRQGLLLKPDAYVARKELANLLEKKGQWNPALAEYEVIHKTALSVESYTDLVRILDKAGYLRAAASEARKAFEKYPVQSQFLLQAGELFHKAGDEAAASAALQEYLKLKPEDGQALMTLGAVFEKIQKTTDALRVYLRAEKVMKDDKNLADALKRLRTGTAVLGGLTVFLPDGWIAEKDAAVHLQGGERVTVAVKTSGGPTVHALVTAREAMPREPFSTEALKQNEQMKKMRQELTKLDPEAAKKMPGPPMPLYNQGDFPGIKGAKKALLSTSDSFVPGMESAVAVAVPSGGKIYVFLWQAARPVTDGEKLLKFLISQTVWPI